MRRYIQPAYTILVANFYRSAGVDGKPTKARIGFRQQARVINGALKGHGLVSGNPAASMATLEVVDNDFTDPAVLNIGGYELVSGIHYVVAGSAALTAVNLAVSINNLPGFTAPAPVGAVITVEGPSGPLSVDLGVVYSAGITNFTLTPANGLLTTGSPAFGPPTIL